MLSKYKQENTTASNGIIVEINSSPTEDIGEKYLINTKLDCGRLDIDLYRPVIRDYSSSSSYIFTFELTR